MNLHRNRTPIALIACVMFASTLHAQIALPTIKDDWRALGHVDPARLKAQLDRSFGEVFRSDKTHVVANENRGNAEYAALAHAHRIFQLNRETESRFQQLLKLRTAIGQHAESAEGRVAAKACLLQMSQWIEFLGRVRFATQEFTQQLALSVPHSSVAKLIADAKQQQIGIVGSALAYVLIEPPPGNSAKPFNRSTRRELLQLIKASADVDIIPTLYELLGWPHTPPDLFVHLVDALRAVGIRQDSNSGQASLSVTELKTKLMAVQASSLSQADAKLQGNLLRWLSEIESGGFREQTYSWGNAKLQPGDWVLQRNPSPYNRFTDLSPGLFTHVGIVARVTSETGKHRIVIVDLPETGDSINASSAESFVSKSLHWIVLRHENAKLAAKMGQIASNLVGRKAQFDLTFNLNLIAEQSGTANSQDPVRTYCAGFLALCAQEAGVPRKSVFPFIEQPANDLCRQNLAKIGMRVARFVSPTGPLFSPNMQVVGMRLPLYSPGRTIKEGVYDRFAMRMGTDPLILRQTSAQKIREHLADVGSQYAWVRKALAKMNDVNPSLDLVAAGRVASIVENLDAIADQQSSDFRDAIVLVQHGRVPAGISEAYASQLEEKLPKLKSSLAKWFQNWQAGKIDLSTLRSELATHFITQGQRHVDAEFFE